MTTVALGEIIDLKKGKKASRVFDVPQDGTRPYIQIDEVRGSPPQLYVDNEDGVSVDETDLCIVWDGANAGTVGYGLRGTIGSTVSRLRIRDHKNWRTAFLGRLLQSKFKEINMRAQSRGATIPHIDKTKLEQIKIPRVNPSDQERIAGILDKADAIRRKRRQALAEIDALLRSCFNKSFGQSATAKNRWIQEPLSEIVERVMVGHVGPSSHAIRDSGVPFLRTQNIGDGEVVTEDIKFVSEDFARSLPKSTLKEGDVIISRHITDRIRSAIVPPQLDGANCANIVIVRPGNNITSSFVHMLLMTEHAQAKLLERQVGSAQRVVNTRAFQTWDVPRPDPGSLLSFEKRYLKIRQLRARLVEGFVAADEFFNSLSQRAFRGQL